MNVECAIPILNVNDIPTSRAFYTGVLGFKEAEWGDDNFTRIDHGKASIFLCHNGQGHHGTWIWIGLEDGIREVYKNVSAQGANIRLPLTNYSWGMEFGVVDPDGHVLRIGTHPDENEPYADLE